MKRVGIVIFILCLMSFVNVIYAATLPNESSAAVKLIEQLNNAKKYDEALDIAQQAEQKWPMVEILKSWKAFLLEELGRNEEAKPIYEYLAKNASDSWQKSYAWGSLSTYARKAGDIENALIYAKKSDSIHTDNNSKSWIANVYYQLGQYKDAMSYYKKSYWLVGIGYKNKETDIKEKSSAQYSVALCHVRLGNLNDAKEIIDKISEKRPQCFSFVEYYALLGDANLAAQELDQNLQCNESPAKIRMLKDIEMDVMKDYVKVKDAQEWKEVIKKWTANN
jgi:tetratricopeptide (TPR) repeat protein